MAHRRDPIAVPRTTQKEGPQAKGRKCSAWEDITEVTQFQGPRRADKQTKATLSCSSCIISASQGGVGLSRFSVPALSC